MIQVSNFACGGIAIGVLISHMIADGTAMSVFLKGWATTAYKTREAICPNFDAPSIFIQNDGYGREGTYTSLFSPFFKSGRFVSRRIVFDASVIASLGAKATSPSVQNPTRVEVVSALLWKCIMAAFEATSGIRIPTFIVQAVNFRRRAVPPFSESSMGNLVWTTCAAEEEIELPDTHCELLKAKVRECASAASSSGINYIAFTSWCNFGHCDIDFAWGKPMWVSSIGLSGDSEGVLSNLGVLMDTISGDGIEAWALLDKEDMDALGQDKELLAFASLDPSPIN
ncbi:hypothetical protein FH972_014073 [Carpinus fangiana]|uniref:Uncharacterized protein n=1 Tax=Carpinus fangiana TaxID=176857 RepID=A0A5N6R8M0_9ROSI|nr:hypothetical protein FH972_014073 [Carpinus fangiana]